MLTRRRVALAALLAVASVAAGCGFTPLYADRTGVAPALAGVAVDSPDNRIGQLLREELEDELARAEGGAVRYRLALDVEERRFPRGLRVDDTANRYELRLIVGYQLRDGATRRVLTRGSRTSTVTYDVADAPYAGIAASLDGQERAASDIARSIRADLGRYFAAPTGPAAAPRLP